MTTAGPARNFPRRSASYTSVVVSRRLLVALVAFVAALAFAGGASAYGWPVRPFNKQHPIRGGFGDPRTVFSLGFFSNPWEGPGSFSFHNLSLIHI